MYKKTSTISKALKIQFSIWGRILFFETQAHQKMSPIIPGVPEHHSQTHNYWPWMVLPLITCLNMLTPLWGAHNVTSWQADNSYYWLLQAGEACLIQDPSDAILEHQAFSQAMAQLYNPIKVIQSNAWASYQIRKFAWNIFPCQLVSAIPPCITARAARACRDACWDR